MSTKERSFDAKAAVRALQHDETTNKSMSRLPSSHTIERRPLNHAPIACARAGASVPKIVYVSSSTPLMSSVKRVKKFLAGIEKRAIQQAGTNMGPGGRGRFAQAGEAIALNREEVLVKATGRAMSQALRVGEWFRSKEKDLLCDVEVRTGSVSVVDDIVEVEGQEIQGENSLDPDNVPMGEEGMGEGGDTTLTAVGDNGTAAVQQPATIERKYEKDGGDENEVGDMSLDSSQKRRKRKRKKRPMLDGEDLPEARIRWVKSVEVAITLKG